jgi:hypothetical protein
MIGVLHALGARYRARARAAGGMIGVSTPWACATAPERERQAA